MNAAETLQRIKTLENEIKSLTSHRNTVEKVYSNFNNEPHIGLRVEQGKEGAMYLFGPYLPVDKGEFITKYIANCIGHIEQKQQELNALLNVSPTQPASDDTATAN